MNRNNCLKKKPEQQKLKGEAINISLPLMFGTNFEEKFSELHKYRYMAVFFTPLLLSHQNLVTKVDFMIKVWTKQRAVIKWMQAVRHVHKVK